MNSKQNTAVTDTGLLTVSPSPHARRGATTSSVMLDVIIALLPATIWGIYVFGARAAVITAPMTEKAAAEIAGKLQACHAYRIL